MLLGSSAFLELDGVLGPLETHLLPCKRSSCNPCVKEKRKTGFPFALPLGLPCERVRVSLPRSPRPLTSPSLSRKTFSADDLEADPVPIQVIVPDDQPEFQAQPPKKIPVKRNTSKVKLSEFFVLLLLH